MQPNFKAISREKDSSRGEPVMRADTAPLLSPLSTNALGEIGDNEKINTQEPWFMV
jgi:hypothetical protein